MMPSAKSLRASGTACPRGCGAAALSGSGCHLDGWCLVDLRAGISCLLEDQPHQQRWPLGHHARAKRSRRLQDGFDPGHADADGTGIRFAGPPITRAALSNIASSGRTAPSGSAAAIALKSSPVPAAISAICT